jgi:ATP-dependent Clp protease adaptor protein ClpS
MADEPEIPDHHDDGEGGGSQGGLLTEQKIRAQRPSLFKVILHNDDYTPMEFVVDVLTRFFGKTHEQATEIMLTVHHKGMAVCGVYPHEIAETKVAMVTETAREHEYPLQCTLERA